MDRDSNDDNDNLSPRARFAVRVGTYEKGRYLLLFYLNCFYFWYMGGFEVF